MAKQVTKIKPAPELSADPIEPVILLIEQARALIDQALQHQHKYNQVIENQVGRLVLLREIIALTKSAESEYETLRKAMCETWKRDAKGEPYSCPNYEVQWFPQTKSFPAKEAHKRTDYVINVNRLVDHD